MNYKLLKELMKQSETECGFNSEKFAELIVRECIDIIEKLPPGYKDYRDQIEDAFRIASVVEIKNRFGIK